MFENLAQRLGGVFDRLNKQGALSEADVATALREVRVALLEADVSLDVARDFVARVQSAATGQAVTKSVTPGQQVIKIVHDQLVQVLTGQGLTRAAVGVSLFCIMMHLARLARERCRLCAAGGVGPSHAQLDDRAFARPHVWPHYLRRLDVRRPLHLIARAAHGRRKRAASNGGRNLAREDCGACPRDSPRHALQLRHPRGAPRRPKTLGIGPCPALPPDPSARENAHPPWP